jgi:hypothetical protein
VGLFVCPAPPCGLLLVVDFAAEPVAEATAALFALATSFLAFAVPPTAFFTCGAAGAAGATPCAGEEAASTALPGEAAGACLGGDALMAAAAASPPVAMGFFAFAAVVAGFLTVEGFGAEPGWGAAAAPSPCTAAAGGR